MGMIPPALPDPGPALLSFRLVSLLEGFRFRDPTAPDAPGGTELDDLVRLGEAVWLVQVVIAGRSYRYASEPVEVFSATTGSVLPFDGGLDGYRITERVAFTKGNATPLTASVDVIWPVDSPSFARLLTEGHSSAAAFGELSIWLKGTQFEQRYSVVSGRVQGPSYGADNEAVSFTIAQYPWEEGAEYPDAARQSVTLETWPDHSPAHLGRVYPTVFGNPGTSESLLSGGPNESPGSEGLLINADATLNGGFWLVLISMQRVAAASVSVLYWDDNGQVIYVPTALVEHTRDGLGTLCAVVFIEKLASFEIDADKGIWIQWSGTGGGVLRLDAKSPPSLAEAGRATATRLSDVVLWLMAESSIRLDVGRSQAALAVMANYRVSPVIEEPIAPLDYVIRQLIAIAPISMLHGAAGVYFLPWRYDAIPAEALVDIVVVPGISRVTPAENVRRYDEIFNERVLSWGWNPWTKTFSRSTLITGGSQPDIEAGNEIANRASVDSATQYGRRAAAIQKFAGIWDQNTAALYLSWWVVREGVAHRVIAYEGPQEWVYLRIGDVVTITDPELELTAEVGVIQSRTLTDIGVVRLEVELIDSPNNDAQITAVGGVFVDQGVSAL